MKVALAALFPLLLALSATFMLSWWSVSYGVETKPLVLNGTKVYVTCVSL